MNHPFDRLEIAYPHNGCSYLYSPVDFCDERHISEIKIAIEKDEINYNGHYILLRIKEWRPSEHYGDSVVVIDAETGVVYPLPFDYFSGRVNINSSAIEKNPRLTFSVKTIKYALMGLFLYTDQKQTVVFVSISTEINFQGITRNI
ncbi:hypothetical protein [Paraburkholderia tagetis]|uniref:Uncharacterized protein n=1 Tax=Paraburkholderia tagetis TaxID=2913261 RepID=A0A9X1RRU7_9BURK|nr:hypothetical protein [Paraburkholderia tagetis]MCG5074702.1 hypothetical protein [Paraburkholderia tagetis]